MTVSAAAFSVEASAGARAEQNVPIGFVFASKHSVELCKSRHV